MAKCGMNTKQKKSQDRRGSVAVDGVTIKWSDSRYMGCDHDNPTEDMDLHGEYNVTVSVADGEIDAINQGLACARRLKMLSHFADLFCPVSGSGHVLKLAGLDDMGGPVWRIVVGGRICDAIPAAMMAHMDPSQYSDSGEAAMKTIAWMRAVGRVTSGWHDKDDTSHVLHRWDEQTLDAACLQFCQPAARAITV